MKYLNGKALLGTLLTVAGVAAILGIAQIWFDFLEWDAFIKAMVTILIVGTISGFLIAVDYDIPASKQKFLLFSTVLMSLILGALTIIQMWWVVMEWFTFAKIFGTILILFLLVSFIVAIKEDFGTSKKLKDENYLD